MSNPSQYTDHRIPVDTTPSIEILNTQPVNEKSFNNLEGANLHRQKMTSSKSSPRILVGPSQAKQLPLTSGTYNTNLHSKPAATFVHSFGIVDSGRDGTVKVIGGDNSLVESRNLDSQDIKENLNKESKSKYWTEECWDLTPGLILLPTVALHSCTSCWAPMSLEVPWPVFEAANTVSSTARAFKAEDRCRAGSGWSLVLAGRASINYWFW